MNLLWPMDPPVTREEMPCIPVHTTWQMTLLWPGVQIWQMNLHLLMTPQYQSRDALTTSTHNLADDPTLADGPPIPKQRCLAYQYIPVVKNGNFTFPLTSSGQDWHFTLLLTYSGQQWQFHIATDLLWSQMAISHCY